MRRGGVAVGVLRVVMGKVYADAAAWHVAFGALAIGRGTLLDGAGIDAVTGCATTADRVSLASMFANCDIPASPV